MEPKAPIYLCLLLGLARRKQTGLSVRPGCSDREDERADSGWGYWKVLRGKERSQGTGSVLGDIATWHQIQGQEPKEQEVWALGPGQFWGVGQRLWKRP